MPAADYLLFRRYPVLALVLFVLIVALAALIAAGPRALHVRTAAGAGILAASLCPLIDGIGPLPVLFALAGLTLFALLAAGWFETRAGRALADLLWFGATGFFRLFRDLAVAVKACRGPGTRRRFGAWLLSWLLPAALGSIFLGLFSNANPLIEQWLRLLDPTALLRAIDGWRAFFWLGMGVLTWPFVRPRLRRRIGGAPPVTVTVEPILPEAWRRAIFGPMAILRSLVLFNGLFAIESGLDVVYLWHGTALPSDLSYAAYAHRGAYPLVVTALLAGGFLIAATRDGSAAARSRPIRLLIHLWTAQNLLLVASSILRLDLYVAAYSLTFLRFAAFIWMLLTATGLVLILVRMTLDRSNAWLVASNFAALTAVLYASSFIDFPGVIADYNVRHSREMTRSGVSLDLDYLQRLGPRTLPALDGYIRQLPASAAAGACAVRNSLAASYAVEPTGWRSWSLNRWRLDRYLADAATGGAGRTCAQIP
ncbi:DUF4153 domain-containing protein [Aliidongia dinghuensis]|nr:DUF4173 domain-containing protein [Aliidongia dinghuensis]